MRHGWFVSAALVTSLAVAGPAFAQKRALTPDDLYNMRNVRDPQLSPDGKWVAFVVSRAVKDTDKNDSDIWMASWDGSQEIRLTSTPEGESHPRWSPDGKYLAFLSSRQESKDAQLWLMNRLGGEAQRVTEVKGGVSDFVWSPDGSRIALVVDAPDPSDPQEDDKTADKDKEKKKTTPPIVITRYHWKEDVEGYLRGERTHLYLFDVASKKAEPLTSGTFNEDNPSWSPDGQQIAFISNRGPGDPDRTTNDDIWLIDAKAGAEPHAFTKTPLAEKGRPAWSPDGKSIAYLLGEDMKWYAYEQPSLMVSPLAGGPAKPLAPSLDRPIEDVTWSSDGSSLSFIVADDRSAYVERVPASGGAAQKIAARPGTVESMSVGKDGNVAVVWTTDGEPGEVYALDGSGSAPRRLSHQNDAWMANVQFGTTEDFTSTSSDGTEVHGVLTKPANAPAGKLPLLLRIHGGPSGQDGHEFSFEREIFAANGYAVLAVNYRGSNGRGSQYQKAIYADWGHKEVIDLLGAVDQAVKSGVADPAHLGIGGWSYGCILTDYTIASDTRFKAATCGAGSANQFAMYGNDEYIIQWETEVGPPWKTPDLWMKLSYPFFHADRIKTPTLYLNGDKDFNVPITGNEQMYQALRSLGVPTELVIYPNQYHGITVPSYNVDRLQRYVDWYKKYLMGSGQETTTTGR